MQSYIKFTANWCTQCKELTKQLKSLESELATNHSIKEVNIEDEPEVALKYGVKGLPTLIETTNEHATDVPLPRMIGKPSMEKLREFLGLPSFQDKELGI